VSRTASDGCCHATLTLQKPQAVDSTPDVPEPAESVEFAGGTESCYFESSAVALAVSLPFVYHSSAEP
jgi:hypothetical protein